MIQLQDVTDTWNWDTPPPHAVPAICHVSEQTATIYATVVIIPLQLTITIIIKYLLTAIRLSPGGSGYFTCIQNMKLVTTEFKWEGYMRNKY